MYGSQLLISVLLVYGLFPNVWQALLRIAVQFTKQAALVTHALLQSVAALSRHACTLNTTAVAVGVAVGVDVGVGVGGLTGPVPQPMATVAMRMSSARFMLSTPLSHPKPRCPPNDERFWPE
jgi:hypothetical protein